MKKEIAKCELRCGVCHTLKTFKGIRKVPHGLYKRKVDLVTIHKLHQRQCSHCKRPATADNLIVFELDHLERNIKTDCISRMCLFGKYSKQDVEKELLKTRMLCRNCHRIHTLQQLYGKGGGLVQAATISIENHRPA